MTSEPPPGIPHPDPEAIAAYVEKKLDSVEAARLEEHVAGCSSCYDTLSETVLFLLDEEPAAQSAPVSLLRRPAFRLAAGLAAAAALALALSLLWRSRARHPEPLVAELAEALGPTRFIEPRLTGGFRHGPSLRLRGGPDGGATASGDASGDASRRGLDAYPPSVIGAVARIRERTEGDTSPAALGALAVTYLVSGDVNKAVKALESATAQAPKDPKLRSDLAAAYLARAAQFDEPADIPKALEAAETAIEIEGAPDEAWWNRALALERLHLVDSAKKAWEDFLERDPSSPWADEARRHIEELPPAQKSTIEEDRARARAAVAEGQAAITALADEAPAILSDYFLAELLPGWADAYLTGQPTAAALRTQAEQVGGAIFRATGDALSRDGADALSRAPSGSNRDPPRKQALGFKALQEAQRVYDSRGSACESFQESRRLLGEGGSPYAEWARERVVVTCLYAKKDPAILPELGRLEALASAQGYRRLLARSHWMQGLFHTDAGEFQRAIQSYGLARDVFVGLRDAENELAVRVRLGYVLQAMGDARLAWSELEGALALLDSVRAPSSRVTALSAAAAACGQQQLSRAPVHLLTAAVEAASRGASEGIRIESLLRRSAALLASGANARAASDLHEARSLVQNLADVAGRMYLNARADAIEGRMLVNTQPDVAVARLEAAIAQFERTAPVMVPDLRVTLARLEESRGEEASAEAQLTAGIEQLESQASSLRSLQQQRLFVEQVAATPFDEMVSFQLARRADPDRALHYLERGRTRQFAASSVPRPQTVLGASSEHPALVPLGPDELGHRLPEGCALVYYASQRDRLVAWVLSRQGAHFVELPLSVQELGSHQAAYAAAVENQAPLPELRKPAGALYDGLVRPLRPVLEGHSTLVVIADSLVRSLPFAGLWDSQAGRFLVQDHRLGLAPSGTAFVLGSAALARSGTSRPRHLLAVGNPRLPPEHALPRLSSAGTEATQIASLYPDALVLTGADATKARFMEALGRRDVVHFAGHTRQDERLQSGFLLLAADPKTRAPGALFPEEIETRDLRTHRVVVLAGCQTAVGASAREGTLGVAGSFLAAGTPTVVATLWDIDDAVARRLFLEFHRRYVSGGDVAEALRQTQLAFLDGADPLLAHPASWAGIVHLGAMASRPARPTATGL